MIVFITNLPSFYKNKLFSTINAKRKVRAIFTGVATEVRNKDFFSAERSYESVQLEGGLLKKLRTVWKCTKGEVDEVVIGGWDNMISLLSALIIPKRKLSALVESSIYESCTTGLKSFVKRLFLKRISKVYVAGELQSELVRALGFKGKIVKIGGCGILNYVPQPPYEERKVVKNFIYVGRLSPEKSLKLLIEAFKTLPQLNLTIVGFGPQEAELKVMGAQNVKFAGAVENRKLPSFLHVSDVLVLPSTSEPWGLVVEEALNNGVPVIVSDRVGCRKDLVTADTGLSFKHNNVKDLRRVILQMTNVDFYNRLRLGVSKLDFNKRAEHQVECFL